MGQAKFIVDRVREHWVDVVFMWNRLLTIASGATLFLLVAMAIICSLGTHLADVRTIGWMMTFSDRDGNLSVCLFTNGSDDPVGHHFEPFNHYEVNARSAAKIGQSNGIHILGAVVAETRVLPPLRFWAVYVPRLWWIVVLAMLPLLRLIMWWVMTRKSDAQESNASATSAQNAARWLMAEPI